MGDHPIKQETIASILFRTITPDTWTFPKYPHLYIGWKSLGFSVFPIGLFPWVITFFLKASPLKVMVTHLQNIKKKKNQGVFSSPKIIMRHKGSGYLALKCTKETKIHSLKHLFVLIPHCNCEFILSPN